MHKAAEKSPENYDALKPFNFTLFLVLSKSDTRIFIRVEQLFVMHVAKICLYGQPGQVKFLN